MMLGRRSLLASLAALGLWPGWAFATEADTPAALLSLLDDRNAAAKLGASWIRQEPTQPGEVLQRLQQRLRWSRDIDASALRQELANAIADDFGSGAVVQVEGWQIARTQAELCALAYFSATGSF